MNELTPSSFRLPFPAGRDDAQVLTEPFVEEEEKSLRDFLRVIRRRLWLITMFCLGTVLAAVIVVLRTIPIYRAEATLLLERNPPQVLNIREATSESQGVDEYDFYRTQYELLKSQALAARVIQEQGLEMH